MAVITPVRDGRRHADLDMHGFCATWITLYKLERTAILFFCESINLVVFNAICLSTEMCLDNKRCHCVDESLCLSICFQIESMVTLEHFL